MFFLKFIYSLLVLLGLLQYAKSLQSINLLDVNINWENQGSQTEFHVTSQLNQISDPSDAWLAIGLNTEPKMVEVILLYFELFFT